MKQNKQLTLNELLNLAIQKGKTKFNIEIQENSGMKMFYQGKMTELNSPMSYFLKAQFNKKSKELRTDLDEKHLEWFVIKSKVLDEKTLSIVAMEPTYYELLTSKKE
ncbi:hypothetical protein [Mesoplasma melaleucae]|uniref:Uncharacterized protein n=1 Tax=Mesoplasma melaleucae TaxID=81459 RepID=A0A2K8NXL0_9MOLU|nr:hypothetical protein [Mesoplasma melaleucae]ATZ18286.1 hypothetical protein EMELA_v1c07990 [Mesoplasma melaleucae]